jgi:uncharacterized membrane protein YfcA
MIQARTVVSTSTLLVSLVGYWYAKNTSRDVVPYVMLGGFIGSLLGETLVENLTGQPYEPVQHHQ